MSGELPSTLSALYDGRVVTFTDYVYDGESVDIYASLEAAEFEQGSSRRMRVHRDGDEWTLEEECPHGAAWRDCARCVDAEVERLHAEPA